MNQRIGRAIEELRSRANASDSSFLRLPLWVVTTYAPLGVQAGWVAAPFLVGTVLRLVTNIILARLLAPEIFGLMLIVNMLRTGAELLSDIGIGQSVVRAKRYPDRAFLDTAWTLQVARGALLTLAMLALAPLLADLYGSDFEHILMAVSVIFLLTGLQSPGLFLMQRNMELRPKAALEVIITSFQCASTIALAYVLPSVWALVWGLLLSTAFASALSYAFGERRIPHLILHREHVHEIVHFGKWVFLATLIYFAASSADRAFFGAVLPMAAVGIYSVARTFSDMVGQLAQRLGALLVFPKISNLRAQGQAMAGRVQQARRHTLALVAVGMGVAIAGSDAFILLFYDPRYHAAAFMLPVLLFGAWFGILAVFAEALLLGCDRPAPGAFANAGKFVVLAIGLPLALASYGVFGGLLVLALAELARWLILGRALLREKMAFFGDDLALTAIMITTAFLTKVALSAIGVVPGLAEWWAMGLDVHG
jgi:O-antigen/teichoic acid export membrane protein